MYLVIREGVNIKGICGIFTDLEQAKKVAITCLLAEDDNYHTYKVSALQINKEPTINEGATGWIAGTDDCELDLFKYSKRGEKQIVEEVAKIIFRPNYTELEQIAIKILNKDGMALDFARDILAKGS